MEHTSPLTHSYLHREDCITGSSLFQSLLPRSFVYRKNCVWDLQTPAEHFLISSLTFFFNPLVYLYFKKLSLGVDLRVSLKNVEGIDGPRLSVFSRGRYPDDVTVSAPLFTEGREQSSFKQRDRDRPVLIFTQGRDAELFFFAFAPLLSPVPTKVLPKEDT